MHPACVFTWFNVQSGRVSTELFPLVFPPGDLSLSCRTCNQSKRIGAASPKEITIYDEECQVTKPTSPLQSAVHVPDFDTLVPAPELSLADAKNSPFRNMTTQLYRERQLWSRNESVEIRYVNGNFVTGTSASLPGVPRHISKVLRTSKWNDISVILFF